MSGVFSSLISLIFPRRCVFCGKLTGNSSVYCGCKIKRQNTNSLPSFEQSKPLDGIFAPFIYTGNLPKAIVTLKNTNSPNSVNYFAKEMLESLQINHNNISFIVPVPMTKSTYKKRGFNQAELLAKSLAKLINKPVNNRLLVRKESSVSQHELSYEKRLENARKSYTPSKKAKLKKDSIILLVDDVYTTGSTMKACAKALKEIGAAKVYGLTISITEKTNITGSD